MLTSRANIAEFCISSQVSTQGGWSNLLKTITCQVEKLQVKVPWSGGDHVINNGKVFCFMPLPENTALPVHVNGYFAVTDDRSRIKWPEYDSNSVHAYWNKLLLSELIVPAYAVLLGCRAALVGYQVASNRPCFDVSTEPYAAWPVFEEVRNKLPWRDLVQPVLQLAGDLPLLWTPADGGKWLGFHDVRFLPSPINDPEKCPKSVIKLLLQANVPIVQLPRSIEETVSNCPRLQEVYSSQKVTPSFVRDQIRKSQSILTAVLGTLPPATLSELLAYVSADLDDSSYHALSGISLLPVLSGKVCQFQCPPSKPVRYVIPPNLKGCIDLIPGIEDVIVDLEGLSDSTQTKIANIATSEKLQLRMVTPEVMCSVLLKKSTSSWCTEQATHLIPSAWKWEPGKSNHPPLEWVDRLWQWLCSVSDSVSLRMLSKVQLPVIPRESTNTQKGIRTLLTFPAKENSTLCTFHPRSPPKELVPVLEKLGLVVVEGSRFLFNHPHIHDVIPNVTVPLVAERIVQVEPELYIQRLSSGEKDTLRMFLASHYGLRERVVPAKYKSHLRLLPIFRAIPESSSRFITLDGSIHPHATPTLPSYPSNWLARCPLSAGFVENLDSPPLSPLLFYSNHLIPFAVKMQYSSAIIWVLKQEIPIIRGSSFYKLLVQQLRIPNRKCPAVWKKTAELYDPRDEQFLALFDRCDDIFPTAEYCEEPHLLDKLRVLGLKYWESIKSDNAFIKERALSVRICTSHGDALKRGKCILQSLVERNFDDALLEALTDVLFIFGDRSPPENVVYPVGLEWYGSGYPHHLYSIREIGLLSPENAILVGSVVPLLCRKYNVPLDHPWLLKAFYKPTVKDVLQQLRKLSALNARDVEVMNIEVMNSTVLCIYKYLERHVEELPSLDIPIWWHSKGRFLSTDRVAMKQPKGLSNLEPFIFFIAHNSELKTFRQLLKKLGVRPKLEHADAILILRDIKETSCGRESNQLSDKELDIVLNLLEWIYKMRFETHGEVLVPTQKNQLVSPNNCTFDDREWVQNTQLSVGSYTFVHPKVHKELAQYFHVQPLSQQVAPSRKLKLKYTQAGPHEKITHRIQHIVKEYATDIDIFKELIQNADDAGATEIGFLVDWRTHPSESLLSDNLRHWQGPALLAYNDAMFSDQDFDHICQLAGETKLKDPLKTGRFGVGFCATYHLTDLPSFISREYFTMFDPHTNYLGDRVSRREPGMRVNLIENQQDLRIYADQFSPYDGLFGCNVFSLPPGGFEGTLFRFPFRSAETASRSEISKEKYTQDKVLGLTSALWKSASEILLFLKHVRKLSLSVIASDTVDVPEVKTIFSVEKGKASHERVQLIKAYSPHSQLQCTHQNSKAEIRLYENDSPVSTTQWLLCSVLGTQRSHQLCSTEDGVKRGLVPLTEVALRVKHDGHCQNPDPVEGHVFCFLPLPIPSGLPFHINGFFDIGKDRRSLTATDDKTFGSEWNLALAKDALPQAILHLLAFLAETFQPQKCPENQWSNLLKSYYSLYDFRQAKGIVCQSLVPVFKKELRTTQLKILWSEAGGGKWVPPRDACIFHGDQEIYSATITVMIRYGYNVVKLPEHLQAMLYHLMQEQNHVVNYQRFCTDVLVPNIGDIPAVLRDEHLLFLLKKCASGRYTHEYEWMKTLLRGRECIPCESTATLILMRPQDLIDCRKSHLANLYDVCDGRFPSKTIQVNPAAMEGLVALGMASFKLRLKDLQERAKTVSSLATCDTDAANQRSFRVLEYIPYHRTSLFHDELKTLRDIPFLSVVKPEAELPWWNDAPFVCPSQAIMYSQKSLGFSTKPVVNVPSELPDCLGIAKIDTHDIMAHFLRVISHFSETEVPPAVAKYLNSEKVMEQIYKYLNIPGMHSTLVKAMVEKLGKLKFIWQDNHFLSASQVVINWQHDCYPYICKLSSTNSQFAQFFLHMGVKETISYEMLLQALERIHEDHAPSQPISDRLLAFVEHVAQQAEVSFEKSSKPIYLPDEHKVMRCTSVLACGKISDSEAWMSKLGIYRSHFEEGRGYFVHSSIPPRRAVLLGARSVLDAVLKEIEDEEFLTGSDFGQEEDLCDRLNCILRKYPADRSIFQEFIQNADDAQASEIVFVLDHRTNYSDQKLFTSEASWTSLQHTPALCIINNRKFTEKDIAGITQLGRGGKEQSPELIGRFGIGFNVSYHLTDCPSFISFDESGVPQNFCVFDPTRSFIPNAYKGRPGKRWRLTKDHIEQFSEQFQPYLLNELSQLANLAPSCLQGLEEAGYVVFRLPLTRHPSDVHPRSSKKLGGSTIFGPTEILKLFEELKQVSSDMLLFLNNLKCISVFEIAQDNAYTHHFTTLLSNPPPIPFTKRAVKAAMLGNSPRPLTEFHEVTVKHMETQSGENAGFCTRTESVWLVQRRVDCNVMSKTLMENAAAHSLQPLGGVAARVDAPMQHPCYVFCFLPMNFPSSLPVHVNGHFLVDDSRKHFEEVRHEGLGEWNKSLIRGIVAPAYADMLVQARKFVSQNGSDWYYSLFPKVGKGGDLASLGLVEAVYSKLFDLNSHVLVRDVPLEGPTLSPQPQWLQLQGGERGYFCVQYVDDRKKVIEVTAGLRKVLVTLQMLITSAPKDIYESFSAAIEEFKGDSRVTPQVVLGHLQRLDFTRASNSVVVKKNVEHILSFILKGFPEPRIKKILQRIPLIVDFSGDLRKTDAIFESRLATLLPHCHGSFVDGNLEESSVGKHLRRIHVIVPLSVEFLAKNLTKPPRSSSPISLTEPLKDILRLLWPYIVESPPLRLPDQVLKKHFSQIPIIPSNRHTLFPVCLAKALVSRSDDGGNVQRLMFKLGCPFVDFTEVGQDHSQLIARLITHCSSASDVVSCLQLNDLKYDVSLCKEEVVSFIALVSTARTEAITEKLQRMQLFEQIDGSFVSVKDCSQVFIIPSGVPVDGVVEISKQRTLIVLKAPDALEAMFYKKVIPNYSSGAVTTENFYKSLILPQIRHMKEESVRKHIMNLANSGELRNLQTDLQETPLICHEGKLQKVSFFFDPEVKFFTTFHSTRLLPKPWCDPKLLPVLRYLGLQTEVPRESWILEAQSLANGGKQWRTPSMMERSYVLLDSLINLIPRVGLQQDAKLMEFLTAVSDIRFIHNPQSPDVCGITAQLFPSAVKHKHCSKQLICFKAAVMFADASLAGLCRAVLPRSCSQVPLSARRALKIELPLTVETVVLNLQELSQMAHKCYLQRDDTMTKQGLKRLGKILVSHYACLDRMEIKKQLYGVARTLSELPCILMEGTQAFKLVQPNQLVKHIEPATALEPFRFQVPSYLLKYTHFMDSLGIPERLSPMECAAILVDINTEICKCRGEDSDDEPYLKVANLVYNELIRLLRECDHTYTLNPNLLFLPNEQNNLVKANRLIYNDVPWYAKRLQGKSTFEFLKQPCPGPSGQRHPPASLGVRLLSTIVTEELDTEMDTPDAICHKELLYKEGKRKERCLIVHRVQSTLRSSSFLEGLRRVYFHEHREPPSEQFEDLIGQLRELKVTCFQTRIRTVLHINHTLVPDTNDCSLLCFLSSKGDQLLLAPHCNEYNPESLLKGLSSAVNKVLNNEVKNEACIAAMFQCEPANIRQELDSCRVIAYDPKTDSTADRFHKPGDIVPLDKMTRQHLPIFMDYVKGQIAIYQSTDGLFRYAEVTEARPARNLSDCSVTITTMGKQSNSSSDVKVTLRVPPLLLYKVLTPSQRRALTRDDTAISSFITPVVLATPPCDSFANLQGWIKNIYDMLQNHNCVTGLVASMITLRLIGHLHYLLVVQNMGRGLFCPAVLEVQKLVLESDLPTCPVLEDREPDMHKALNDVSESIRHMTLEDSDTDSDSDSHVVQSGREMVEESQQQKPSCAPRQRLSLPPKRWFYGYPADRMESPKPNSAGNTGMPSAQPTPDALPLQHSSPVNQPSRIRFPSRGGGGGRRGQMPLIHHRLEHPQELPKVRKPPVCLHSAHMWLEQAKADFRAALFLAKQFGADDPMELDSEELQGQVNAYPALVCFLCHETLVKCLKGILYAFCGLPSALVNEGRLVSLLQPLKTSTDFPDALKKPLEECVMHINQHEHMSRLPNYQNPPCAPAVMYSHCDAHEALSAVRSLLDCLVGDEKLKELIGDIAQLPKPKFQSMLKSMGDSALDFPDTWEQQGEDEDFKLVVLDPEEDSDECERIQHIFFQTMPGVTNLKIERVQNRLLWRKYCDCSKRMLQFGGGTLNEKLLFHGSRNTNPEEIYKGDAGFDMRFSNNGMWGRGNYFAVNASYSHGYARVVKGFRKMLAAWVLTGHCKDSRPHPYQRPPEREDTNEAGSESAIRSRYDSVSGSTGGSKVYITYDNEHAYPAYVITYQ